MLIIVEIGQAHEGSLGIAHSYIDALADTGVDAVKFQTHIAEAESSIQEPFRKKFSYEDERRIDYWQRMEFTVEQWRGLKDHCEAREMEFISSPFSNAAVDLLEELGVNRYKIGSGEVTNFLMLEKIAKTGKPILLSSGMSSYHELDDVLSFLNNFENEISILQCTTAYPTKPEEWGLNVIQELKNRYNIPVGFSDHSGDIFACLSAASLGADILEFHAVFDKRMFGPDSKASLTIDEIGTLVRGVRMVTKSLNDPIEKNDNHSFKQLKDIFGKSLAVNRDIKKDEIISFDDLESKKPKNIGIDASKYQDVIGKKVNRDLKKWDFLKFEHLENT
jgi:N-acetylneuraminate synthase